jgi:hypothetical protein
MIRTGLHPTQRIIVQRNPKIIVRNLFIVPSYFLKSKDF